MVSIGMVCDKDTCMSVELFVMSRVSSYDIVLTSFDTPVNNDSSLVLP